MGSRLESNSSAVRKRIVNHTFEDEAGEEYDGSSFGGFSDYFRRKKMKLQNLDADIRSHSTDKPAIFKGVVAHVNGYTQPSLSDLHTLIVQHGGGFMQYLDGKTTVTHIIASSLTPKKVVEFKRYRIVKPAWVVDSIKAGKLLPWNNYRVVDEGERQKLIAFDGGKVSTQTNVRNKGYRDQTDGSWYTNQLRSSQPTTFTGTPSSSIKSKFVRQRLPTPDDGIEDLPPSHQTELNPQGNAFIETILDAPSSKKLVTPPKTSPAPEDVEQPGTVNETLARSESQESDMYADSIPPDFTRVQSPSVEENIGDSNDRDLDAPLPPGRNKILTAEEHNAILLQDPKIRKSTVLDPNFLEQYYRESRLHHLSAWKADLKSQLQALASEKSSSQKSRQKRPPGSRRYILHVDFDSFFAAVSLKKYPQYIDKPAVVAHGSGSGSEIASCNYPARKFGIKNGMWMKRAQEMCPELKVLPYDFPAYEEMSRAFYEVIIGTGGIVQSVSIDEALVDVSVMCIAAGGSDGKIQSEGSIYHEQVKADEIAQSIRDQVRVRTDCNVSVGIGANILLAKVALRKAKPAGQHQIKPEDALDFVGQLKVQDLPGVAGSIGGKLEDIGINFVRDIRDITKERLVQVLGPKTGGKLWEYSRGIDRTELGEQVVRKSVSAEVNWGVRFENQNQADEFICNLCGELQKRLLKEKVKGKQLTMKVMRRSPDAPLDPPKHLGHGHCITYSKTITLGVATNSKEVLSKEALSILRGFGFSPGELRGVGAQMTKIEPMKNAKDGSLDSSQRRLQFRVGHADRVNAHESSQTVKEDPIQDDPETPKKSKTREHIAFGAAQLNISTPSRRPLNTMGTQFLIPTQVDPKVLAELPADIRSKLVRQPRQSSPTPASRNTVKESTVQRPNPFSKPAAAAIARPPEAHFPLTALPAPSQLDPDILAALPPDIRAEVLSQYVAGATPSSPSSSPSRKQRQTFLPQSPRKNRLIGIAASKTTAPIKRGRGRPPRSAQLAASAAASVTDKQGRTLKQASFFTPKNPAQQPEAEAAVVQEQITEPVAPAAPAAPAEEGLPPLDPSFLAALPPDLRAEIIADHSSAQQLALARAKNRRAQSPPRPSRLSPVLRVPRPIIPTFTAQKLSSEKAVRKAVGEWVKEFADEGPYAEDTGALVVYLAKVIREEGDLAKATSFVRWLVWVVGGLREEERSLWRQGVKMVKDGVRTAARMKGLGKIKFD
jgi:DNA repair protein REV1